MVMMNIEQAREILQEEEEEDEEEYNMIIRFQ